MAATVTLEEGGRARRGRDVRLASMMDSRSSAASHQHRVTQSPPIVITRRSRHLIKPRPLFKNVIMVPIFIAMVMRSFFVSGQNCFGGIETFEKVAMADFDETYTPAGILLQQTDQALTRDCINLCKQQPTCLSFGLDYIRFRCAAYAVNSHARPNDLVNSNTTNYFEKVCYRGVARDEYEKVS